MLILLHIRRTKVRFKFAFSGGRVLEIEGVSMGRNYREQISLSIRDI